MNAVFRDVEAGLRRARLEAAFTRAVSGVREWLSGMTDAAALPRLDAMDIALDVGALLDPLADSALATVAMQAAVAADALPGGETPASRGWSPVPLRQSRLSIVSRFATEGAATPPMSNMGALRAPARAPLRVASLLARHDRLRAACEASAGTGVRWEPAVREGRKVVPLSRHGSAREASASIDRAQPAMLVTAAIARWSGAASRDPAERAQTVAGSALSGDPLAPVWRSLQAPERALMTVVPRRAEQMVKLAKLTATSSSVRAQPARLASVRAEPAMPSAAVSVLPAQPEPALSSSPPGASIGHVLDSLARIEDRLTAQAPSSAPAPQWLDDDDGLAERIHDLLRRQVQRHGIDLP